MYKSILLAVLVIAGCAHQPANRTAAPSTYDLHKIVVSDTSALIPALTRGADIDALSKRPVACPNGRDRAPRGVTPREVAEICQQNDVLEAFAIFDRDRAPWLKVKELNTPSAYRNFMASYPDNVFVPVAIETLQKRRIEIRADLKSHAVCALQEPDWYWMTGDCPDGIAQGEGHALQVDGNEYKGQVVDGHFSKGQLKQDGRIVYDGSFFEGMRHGEGVCLYESSYEPCRYYRNDRIDDVYVQRQLMARHMEYLRAVRGAGGQPGQWFQPMTPAEREMIKKLKVTDGYGTAVRGE